MGKGLFCVDDPVYALPLLLRHVLGSSAMP